MKHETRWELSWQRPENLQYPKVWHRFEAISKRTGREYKIKIQDIPPDRFEEAVEFNEKNMDHYEPIFKAVKIWDDPESVIAHKILRQKILEQKISLMAVIDKEDNTVHSKSEMIGTLLFGVKSKTDPPTKQAGKELNKVFDLFDNLINGFDIFQFLESDCHIFHWGVTVAPKYYGLGVGFELELQSRVVGKACGIKGSYIVFSSIYSQPFWKKLGCTFIKEVRYDECKYENGEIIIPNIVNGSLIFVVWKYL